MHFVEKSLAFIHQLLSENEYSCIDEYGEPFRAKLSKKQPKGFELIVPVKDPMKRLKTGSAGKIAVIDGKKKIIIDHSFFTSSFVHINEGDSAMGNNLSVQHLSRGKLETRKKYYCQEIIPIPGLSAIYHTIASAGGVKTDSGTGTILWNTTFGENEVVEFYILKGKEQEWLVLENTSPMTPGKFRQLAWATLIATGYMTGYLPQNESYQFYRKTKKKNFDAFEYRTLRNSLKSGYVPLYVNSHGLANITLNKARYFYNKINFLSHESFSTLCKLIHAKVEIKSIVLLMLESMAGTLIIHPAGMSIALEGLTEFICEGNADAVKSIPDKKKSRAFIKAVLDLSETQFKDDKTVNREVLSAKIMDLNRPTNQSKLTKPFEIMEITLSALDIEVIKYRNDFLHGNISLVTKGKKYTMGSYEITLRLMTLVNCLLLKMIGHKGYIVNHTRAQKKTKPGEDADFFILL